LNASDSEEGILGFTKLVAMVTRDFGASPFFKVVVEQKGKISVRICTIDVNTNSCFKSNYITKTYKCEI